MEKVTGIGGFFIRTPDPERLAAWYQTHLGITLPGPDGVWMQEAGPTVLATFAEDSDYFGRSGQAWMINFRVSDLDAMMAQLRAADIAVEARPEWNSAIGRFARIHDPDGNPVELWEPASP